MAGLLDNVDQRTQLAGHNRLELLLFFLGEKQRFGINVFKIQEVLMCPALTQIPHSHPVVKGVATIRGKTIQVIDMNMAIGGQGMDDYREGFVIVTEYNRNMQGFLVNGVDRIINMKWDEILPPPKGVSSQAYMTAVTHVNDDLVEILDVEKILFELQGGSAIISEDIIDDHEADEEKSYHILVADDSAVARSQVTQTIEQLGYEFTACRDGKEAYETLKAWSEEGDPRFDNLLMVISDIEMPEMDGYTFATKVRENEKLKDVYFLLHSSLSGVFNNSMVKQVGADDFIAKFKPDELAAAVLKRLEMLGDVPVSHERGEEHAA